MSRKVMLAALVVGLFVCTMLLGMTTQNEGCLPWQERVGYGDGPFGEQQDYSTCR